MARWVYLVQHGEAKPEEEDPQRPLTPRGREEVQRVAAWAARAGIPVDVIEHSGKLRAQQTAEILAAALQPPQGVRAVAGLAPLDDVRPVAERLAQGEERVMLVGHLPFMSRLASLLLVEDPEREIVRFRYGGILCLGRVEAGWRVLWMVTPDVVPQ